MGKGEGLSGIILLPGPKGCAPDSLKPTKQPSCPLLVARSRSPFDPLGTMFGIRGFSGRGLSSRTCSTDCAPDNLKPAK